MKIFKQSLTQVLTFLRMEFQTIFKNSKNVCFTHVKPRLKCNCLTIIVVHIEKESKPQQCNVCKGSFISETFDNFDHLNHHWPKIPANLNSFFGGQISLRLKFKVAGILGQRWLK